MQFSDIPLPDVYKESADFRFFVNWFNTCLQKIKYDTENISNVIDPLRCPDNLLPLLADTMGYEIDDRVPISYNRLVLLYFMSLIYNRGSKTGMMLAAELNLAQLPIIEKCKENPVLNSRLEDTTIPVNSAYVTPHTASGYVDVVYLSEKTPIDVCTEYVRPLGMYCFQNAGVRVDSRTKISVDARLTNSDSIGMSIGSTHVGHYSRKDYASMHNKDPRDAVYYRNSDAERGPSRIIDPGKRTLYSLQVCNNDNVVAALLPSVPSLKDDPIFSLGAGKLSGDYPNITVDRTYPDDYLKVPDKNEYNLRYDKSVEEKYGGIYSQYPAIPSADSDFETVKKYLLAAGCSTQLLDITDSQWNTRTNSYIYKDRNKFFNWLYSVNNIPFDFVTLGRRPDNKMDIVFCTNRDSSLYSRVVDYLESTNYEYNARFFDAVGDNYVAAKFIVDANEEFKVTIKSSLITDDVSMLKEEFNDGVLTGVYLLTGDGTASRPYQIRDYIQNTYDNDGSVRSEHLTDELVKKYYWSGVYLGSPGYPTEVPAVSPIARSIGDSISIGDSMYIMKSDDGTMTIRPESDLVKQSN